MSKESIVVFAQTPPPEHGQSRMVAKGLEVLSAHPDRFDVHHVNARFSEHLEEIGEGSIRKAWRGLLYLLQALRVRFHLRQPVLYYVPGPVKWSAVVRDWLLLGILRLFFRRIVFHWHAIGQGEWAHGSSRLVLPGPRWLDQLGRRLSAVALGSPTLSMCVCETSELDARVVQSRKVLVVPNGMEDPCGSTGPVRVGSTDESVRLLFLSHGTEAKGLFDFLDAVELLAGRYDGSGGRVHIVVAGGISEAARARFDEAVERLGRIWGVGLRIEEVGFVADERKDDCFRQADIFVSPSRWESFGLTVVEAMAWGVPVVAASSDGVRGVLGSDYRFLVPIADPEALAGKLSEAIRCFQAGDMGEFGRALRQRYEERFTSKCFADAFLAALSPREVAEPLPSQNVRVLAYLADQNPKLGRSLGISRMTEVVLGSLLKRDDVILGAVVSRSSIAAPSGSAQVMKVPWSTRGRVLRLLTDNLHPLFTVPSRRPDVWYFPKGFMPRLHGGCEPAVATIHDTIIQYYQDHYPKWRLEAEYSYWAGMLCNTLRHASAVMTVSEHAKGQIEEFIRRHDLPARDIFVTYEPCLYEKLPQPERPAKADYVLHLGSQEPHKRTTWLIELWIAAIADGRKLPKLHVVGKLPEQVEKLVKESRDIVYLPFLEDRALISQFSAAKALILPSEVEGFGLPAIEAYYLGTPVCYTLGTSVEEVLAPAHVKGGFDLEDPDSLWVALEQVLDMSAAEVRECGLGLREAYGSDKVVERMVEVFQAVAGKSATR